MYEPFYKNLQAQIEAPGSYLGLFSVPCFHIDISMPSLLFIAALYRKLFIVIQFVAKKIFPMDEPVEEEEKNEEKTQCDVTNNEILKKLREFENSFVSSYRQRVDFSLVVVL